jgi:hypothetical protein
LRKYHECSANKSLFTALKPSLPRYFIKKMAVVRVLPSPKI